jgi:hypothetical protein
MPCFETRETTVALEAADLEALADAMQAEGHSVTRRSPVHLSGVTREGYSFAFEDGRITTDQRSALARDPNAVKRAYSRETVTREARRAGWQARFVGDSFTLTKRRF